MTKKTTKKAAAKKKTARQAYEAKTQAVSVRIDPVVKYALDLMARAQRRSVSSVIEWAVIEAAKTTRLGGAEHTEIDSIKALADHTYSPNEIERVVWLGICTPDLLDFDERRIWTVIRLTPELWIKPNWHRIMQRPNDDVDEVDFDWWVFRNNLELLEPIIREAAETDPVKGLSSGALQSIGWEGEIEDRRELLGAPW